MPENPGWSIPHTATGALVYRFAVLSAPPTLCASSSPSSFLCLGAIHLEEIRVFAPMFA